MYDPWGVGEAVQHGMRMFSHGKRATGRSTMLLNSVKDRDTVVFAQRMEAQRMERLFMQVGKKVKTIVKDPSQGIGEALSYLNANYDRRGDLHFDHSWFEAIYLYEMRGVMHTMSHFYNAMADQRGKAKEDEDRHRTYRPFPSDYRDTVNAVAGGDWAHD